MDEKPTYSRVDKAASQFLRVFGLVIYVIAAGFPISAIGGAMADLQKSLGRGVYHALFNFIESVFIAAAIAAFAYIVRRAGNSKPAQQSP
jgi:hypothetical protein